MNTRQRIVVLMMNFLILTELVYCMYLGSLDPEYQALFLLKTYVPFALATLYAGRKVVQLMGPVPRRDWINPLSSAVASRETPSDGSRSE